MSPSVRPGNDDAFTGLEAAIVLIAFTIVASVFAYTVLGTGFMATQQAQKTAMTGSGWVKVGSTSAGR